MLANPVPSVIDDYFPVGPQDVLLCANMDPPDAYWAALLEKAVSVAVMEAGRADHAG